MSPLRGGRSIPTLRQRPAKGRGTRPADHGSVRADTLCFRFALLFCCHPERSPAESKDLLFFLSHQSQGCADAGSPPRQSHPAGRNRIAQHEAPSFGAECWVSLQLNHEPLKGRQKYSHPSPKAGERGGARDEQIIALCEPTPSVSVLRFSSTVIPSGAQRSRRTCCCHPARSAAESRDLPLSSRAERSVAEGPAVLAPTLIVYGDRDPLCPVEMSIEMYRAIPRSALWIVPNGGHGPIFFDAAPLSSSRLHLLPNPGQNAKTVEPLQHLRRDHACTRICVWESRSSPT